MIVDSRELIIVEGLMTRSGVIRVIEVVRLEEIASTSVETIRGVDNHLLRVTQGVVQLRGKGLLLNARLYGIRTIPPP